MNFDHRRTHDEPEINLIPLIDVLLVVLIFLLASTSFIRTRQLPVSLPQAQAQELDTQAALNLTISRDNQYALGEQVLPDADLATLSAALKQAASQQPDAGLRINADQQATHGAVVLALEAARQAHISRVYFLTEAAR